MNTYLVNDIFYSLQGEGARAGEPSLFLRFSKCNLACRRETEGFDCDTEFESGKRMTPLQIVEALKEESATCKWIVMTGGEPTLQVDNELVASLHGHGYRLAIETNGSREVPAGIDYITVSPHVAEHAIVQRHANEVRYVRSRHQALPRTVVAATHYYLSPTFNGNGIDRQALLNCIELAKENPPWRVSVQMHKAWMIP